MTIVSSPFSGVKLTGEDADAFVAQVERGLTADQKRTIDAAIERGRKILASIDLTGRFKVSVRVPRP